MAKVLTNQTSQLLGGRGPRAWYRAGGAPLPVAVYQPKGAASLAASYINLANPGTNDCAIGKAPTFAAATGWTFAAASTQYLTTGIVGIDKTWSLAIRWSSGTDNLWPVCVLENGKLRFGIRSTNGPNVNYNNGASSGGETTVSPNAAAGTFAIAGASCYRNGTAEGTITQGTTAPTTIGLTIGARNLNGTIDGYYSGNVLAVVVWNVTLTAGQVAAVSAAMALI